MNFKSHTVNFVLTDNYLFTHLHLAIMISTIRQTFVIITLATLLIVAECGASHRKSRLPTSSWEEEDMERYKKPFRIIFGAIVLSVAPPLLRFIHCLFTDPAVPLLYKEMKLRGMEMMTRRFGLIEREQIHRDNHHVHSISSAAR